MVEKQILWELDVEIQEPTFEILRAASHEYPKDEDRFTKTQLSELVDRRLSSQMGTLTKHDYFECVNRTESGRRVTYMIVEGRDEPEFYWGGDKSDKFKGIVDALLQFVDEHTEELKKLGITKNTLRNLRDFNQRTLAGKVSEYHDLYAVIRKEFPDDDDLDDARIGTKALRYRVTAKGHAIVSAVEQAESAEEGERAEA